MEVGGSGRSPVAVQPCGSPAPWQSSPGAVQPRGSPAPWQSSPGAVRPQGSPPRPGFRSTLGAGDVLAHFLFPGKFQSPVTHQKCRVFDPVSFDKDDGASLPVLAVGPDWPDLDFFFDPKSEVGFRFWRPPPKDPPKAGGRRCAGLRPRPDSAPGGLAARGGLPYLPLGPLGPHRAHGGRPRPSWGP